MNDDQRAVVDNLIADAIDASEDIRDPLEGLVEKTTSDPGSPFEPGALERLATLKKDDLAAFEALRAQLRKAGCRVTALDEAIAEENGDTGGRGPTQADILIELAQTAELFHTPDSTGYVDLDINGHRETWPIRNKGFKRWLARRFFEATQGAPSSEALQSALNVIEARAHFDAPERAVHIRVGGLDGRLYLDLGDETWRAVEIDATGWRVIDNPPVRFRRASGMQPLPVPVKGGSVETLRSFLNVQSDADFVLAVAWALACLRNRGYRLSRCRANRVPLNRPSRQFCGRCSIPTPRRFGPCLGRTATCLSRPTMAMSSPSTTCRAYRHGFRILCAGLPPAAVLQYANCTPTRMKCCSTPPVQSCSMGLRIS